MAGAAAVAMTAGQDHGQDPSGPPARLDRDLLGLDVEAAISRGLLMEGTARRAMFTEAAIAASWQAERLGVGPYPLRFLGGYVRTAGRSAALDLPEPLIGDEPTRLARDWIAAASAAGAGIGFDDVFAQWLEMVAALIAVRRVAQRRGSGAVTARE